MFARSASLCRELFLRSRTRSCCSQLCKLCSSASELESFKTRIKSGPSLQHFIASSAVSSSANNAVALEQPHPYVSEADVDGKGRKVYLETYGCQMNVNDMEIAWTVLKKAGFEKTEDPNAADVILIMTCAIREGAESKIWFRLQQLKALRKSRKKDRGPLRIGVLGCMAERLKEKLLEREKGVDVVAGPDSYRDLPRLLSVAASGRSGVNVALSLDETYADIVPVRLSENSKSAYVSIMRGCNNMCSYCIVPFTRGRERSRPMASILEEVRILSDQGVKEVTLLGQNVNSYRDTSAEGVALVERPRSAARRLSRGFRAIYRLPTGGVGFSDLLDKVSEVDPEMRIRFTSPHPKDFPDEVLEVIRERPNICKQLHLPAQSGNSQVLERMRRGYTREAYLELVERIRNFLPGVCLTSDFICGFCGETEEAHQDTLSLVKAVRYSFAYVFAYSMREKTHAHHRMEDDVPEDVKKQRVAEVLAAFRIGAKELYEDHVGSTQLVLVEGASRRSVQDLVGRNDGNTRVVFRRTPIPTSPRSEHCREVQPGDYIAVKIDGCSSQVLKGTALHHSTLKSFATGG